MLDLQSPCPGGRKKKIKDCCSSLVKELDQIYTMLEGKQFSACQNLIETLEKSNPDCTCLLLAKAISCRIQQKNDEALAILLPLAKKEPDNSRILTELALLYTIQGQFKEAISCVIDAAETFTPGSLNEDVLEMMLLLVDALVRTAQYLPAVALLQPIRRFSSDQDPSIARLIMGIFGDQRIPPIFKSLPLSPDIPESYEKRVEYDEYCVLAIHGHWKKALAGFEALSADPNAPSGILWNKALLRLWLFDIDQGIEDLKKFMAAPDTKEDEAVDAQILTGFLRKSILDDDIRIRRLSFTVVNPDSALEKLLSEPTFVVLDTDFSQYRDETGAPPPEKGFLLLDKPRRSLLSGENETNELPPLIKGQAFLFGKQTDREARLVLMEVPESEMMPFENKLRNILGDDLGGLEENDDFGEMSETDLMLFPRFYFNDPSDREGKTEKYHDQYNADVFIPWWLNHPLGILDGKTPLEASKMPEYHVQLLAAILSFEYKIQEPEIVDTLTAKLRGMLSIPAPEEINVEFPEGEEDAELEMFVPVWRWKRIDFSKLPSRILLGAFSTAKVFALVPLGAKIAALLIERTDLKLDPSVYNACLELLVSNAYAAGDPEQIRIWLERAYQYSLDSGQSDGRWHLMELMQCLRLNNAARFDQLLRHLTSEHRSEQDIMEALSQLMMQLGFVPGARQGGAGPMGAMPTGSPAAPVQEKQGLWTPGSENAGNEGGGSKLWIPGND